MKIITWLFFGTLGYWLVYGTSYAGNEIMLAIFILGGFITFLIGMFIALFWWFVSLVVITIGWLVYVHFQKKKNIEARFARLRARK